MEQDITEASSRIELDDGRVLTRCDQCRSMHGERSPPNDPPCETCWVELKKENEDALQIFYVIQDQFLMGQNGPIAINHLAIHSAMELYGIQNRRDCFEKVLRLSRWNIEKINSRGGD